ncbi:MAG: ShlB/FhaC/HecB family hemolysin secretion/activation protein [Pseudomonadota bacterium]
MLKVAFAASVAGISILGPMMIGPSSAQQSIIDDSSRDIGPGRTRPELPALEDLPKPGFELPPVAPESERRAASGVQVEINRIDFEGNTVFSDEELSTVAEPYVGRKITTSELLELRDLLTRHYIDAGHVNSGAVIPDQAIDRGRIVIRIVEGRLSEIATGGLTRLDPNFVESRIRYRLNPVLDVNQLRERIELLLLDPSIDRLDARLNPGERPGESRLALDVDEAPPYRMAFVIANDRAPSVGAERGEATFTYVDVSGRSDLLSFGFGVSAGSRDLSFDYDTPLTAGDIRAFISTSYAESEIIEEPFNAIDIESETLNIETGISLPLIRSVRRELRVDTSLEHKRSKTFLFDQPTSLSLGVGDGRSNVTALRFKQNFRVRERQQALALQSTISYGLNLLGATQNRSGIPDAQFFAWLGQAQYARRLGSTNWQATFRGDVQLTPDPLLAIERIGIGGGDTVRGYRQNELVFDNGWVVSAGLQIPAGRVALPGVAKSLEDGRIRITPFVDAGGGWNTDAPDGDITELVSVGLGLGWNIVGNTDVKLDFGLPLIDTDSPESEDLQDFGIHFRLSTDLSG